MCMYNYVVFNMNLLLAFYLFLNDIMILNRLCLMSHRLYTNFTHNHSQENKYTGHQEVLLRNSTRYGKNVLTNAIYTAGRTNSQNQHDSIVQNSTITTRQCMIACAKLIFGYALGRKNLANHWAQDRQYVLNVHRTKCVIHYFNTLKVDCLPLNDLELLFLTLSPSPK